MIFDPCGDLLKDYSAFCQALRVTEREDVYSAIHAREVEVPPLSSEVQDKTTTPAAATQGAASGAGGAAGDAGADGKGAHAGKGAAAGGKDKAADGPAGKRRSLRKASLDAGPKPAEDESPSPPPPQSVTITSVALHYPVFCLNQRDMTPLSRAIPHCPSLLAVELVGCGLSVQSYMQLVETVYRSPRVLSVAVDFNHNPPSTAAASPLQDGQGKRSAAVADTREQTGFVLDPTLRAAPSSAHPDAMELSVSGARGLTLAAGQTSEPFTDVPIVPVPSADEAAGTATSSGKASGTAGKAAEAAATGVAAARNQRTAQGTAADATVVEVTVLSENPEEEGGGADGALFFYPTQYCGLDQQPTPLELQLQEETEKKGKVDGKRLQQVQAQRDAVRAFNQQNRMAVPRTWDGILYTGIHVLSLRGNGIDDTGVARLVDVLLHNPRSQLESLNLWGNRITDAGAASLAQLLHQSRDLCVLDIGNNELSDVGVLDLVDTLRMQPVTTPEELAAARRAYLTRRGASEEERRAAAQPLLPTDIPSYEDLYAHWWYTQQQLQQQQRMATASLPFGGERPQSGTTGDTSDVCRNLSLSSALYPPPPPPPQRDASLSPSAPSNSKRASPAKSKTTKSESVPNGSAGIMAATMSSSAARAAMRPTAAFDRDCVRVCHLAESDPTIRVPGNTVLEVLNLEGNRHVTIAGAREAARRLSLREPASTAEMLGLVEVRDGAALLSMSTSAPLATGASAAVDGMGKRLSGGLHRTPTVATVAAPPAAAATPATVIRAPELHCAGLRLRMCSVCCYGEADRETWAKMDEVQHSLDAALAVWNRPRPLSLA